MKRKLISGLRDPEAKLRPVDGIKTKPTMTLSEMTESLQFRSQAMAFASSSTEYMLVTKKKKVGYNFKKSSKEFTVNKSNGYLCYRCGGRPHSS